MREFLMPTGRDGAGRHYATCAAAVAWFGLGLQLYVTLATAAVRERSLLIAAGEYFSYFTILTNLLVAVALTVKGQRTRERSFFNRPSVLGGLTVALVLVAVAYNLLLRQRWHPQGLGRVADETLHVVTPALYVLYWFLYVPKGVLPWAEVLAWLIYPLGYLLYVLVLGALSGFYPYYFLDVRTLGYRGVLSFVGGLTLALLALGGLVVFVDGVLGRRRAEPP
jgi:hypothetical protein